MNSDSRAPGQQVSCPVCWEDLALDHFLVVGSCAHELCMPCAAQIIQRHSTVAADGLTPLRCPVCADCAPVEPLAVSGATDSSSSSKSAPAVVSNSALWQVFAWSQTAASLPRFHKVRPLELELVLRIECAAAANPHEEHMPPSVGSQRVCPSCGEEYEPAARHTCAPALAARARDRHVLLEGATRALGFTPKTCPQCGISCVRFRGHRCHHVTCCCRATFCIVCLERWPHRSAESCSVICDETCDCMPCPDCRPGKSCSECFGPAACVSCRGEGADQRAAREALQRFAQAQKIGRGWCGPRVVPPQWSEARAATRDSSGPLMARGGGGGASQPAADAATAFQLHYALPLPLLPGPGAHVQAVSERYCAGADVPTLAGPYLMASTADARAPTATAAHSVGAYASVGPFAAAASGHVARVAGALVPSPSSPALCGGEVGIVLDAVTAAGSPLVCPDRAVLVAGPYGSCAVYDFSELRVVALPLTRAPFARGSFVQLAYPWARMRGAAHAVLQGLEVGLVVHVTRNAVAIVSAYSAAAGQQPVEVPAWQLRALSPPNRVLHAADLASPLSAVLPALKGGGELPAAGDVPDTAPHMFVFAEVRVGVPVCLNIEADDDMISRLPQRSKPDATPTVAVTATLPPAVPPPIPRATLASMMASVDGTGARLSRLSLGEVLYAGEFVVRGPDWNARQPSQWARLARGFSAIDADGGAGNWGVVQSTLVAPGFAVVRWSPTPGATGRLKVGCEMGMGGTSTGTASTGEEVAAANAYGTYHWGAEGLWAVLPLATPFGTGLPDIGAAVSNSDTAGRPCRIGSLQCSKEVGVVVELIQPSSELVLAAKLAETALSGSPTSNKDSASLSALGAFNPLLEPLLSTLSNNASPLRRAAVTPPLSNEMDAASSDSVWAVVRGPYGDCWAYPRRLLLPAQIFELPEPPLPVGTIVTVATYVAGRDSSYSGTAFGDTVYSLWRVVEQCLDAPWMAEIEAVRGHNRNTTIGAVTQRVNRERLLPVHPPSWSRADADGGNTLPLTGPIRLFQLVNVRAPLHSGIGVAVAVDWNAQLVLVLGLCGDSQLLEWLPPVWLDPHETLASGDAAPSASVILELLRSLRDSEAAVPLASGSGLDRTGISSVSVGSLVQLKPQNSAAAMAPLQILRTGCSRSDSAITLSQCRYLGVVTRVLSSLGEDSLTWPVSQFASAHASCTDTRLLHVVSPCGELHIVQESSVAEVLEAPAVIPLAGERVSCCLPRAPCRGVVHQADLRALTLAVWWEDAHGIIRPSAVPAEDTHGGIAAAGPGAAIGLEEGQDSSGSVPSAAGPSPSPGQFRRMNCLHAHPAGGSELEVVHYSQVRLNDHPTQQGNCATVAADAVAFGPHASTRPDYAADSESDADSPSYSYSTSSPLYE